MAISFYTGIPRSGKSLKAVALLYHTFVKLAVYFRFILGKSVVPRDNEVLLSSKDFYFFNICKFQKKILYSYAYTNINQFNFEISPLIKKLDFDSLYDNLCILHAHYLDKKDDDYLISIAKSMNLYYCLFVIDEAHNYFKGKDNPVLVWWFTYHAHFSHDIILITQDLKLVNDEYKRVGEYFYKAIPQRLRLSKSVCKYRSYSSYNMYQKDFISSESLKVDPLYFTLFVSGSHTVNRSIFYRYILLFSFFFLMSLYFAFTFYQDLISRSVPESVPIPTTDSNKHLVTYPTTMNEKTIPSEKSSTTLNKSVVKDEVIENLQIFKFDCYSTNCNYKNSFEFPKQFLDSIIKDIDKSKVHIKLFKNHSQFHLLIDANKLNFLPKDINNEKANSSVLPNH